MANIGIVSQSPQENTVSLPAGRTFIRFKNVDPTNNHTVELVPLDSNSQIVTRPNDTNDWTKTDDGFGISLFRDLTAGNTAKQLVLDYQIPLNMSNTTPITVLDKRRNINVGSVDMSTYKGDVSGQLTEVARQLQVILTNAGFVNSVTVNSKQGISINIKNTKTIDKVIEIYSNVTDNTGTVLNLTAADSGVVNSVERKPSGNPFGNHAITFAISATPRVAPVISTANATDSTTGITINDTDVFDVYVDNLDVPKYANLTRVALLQIFSPTSDEDIEIVEQTRTITCVGALPYAQGIAVQTQPDGIINFSNVINGSTQNIQMRQDYMLKLNAIQNLEQSPTAMFTVLPDQTDRALISMSQAVPNLGQKIATPNGIVITTIDGVTLQNPIVLFGATATNALSIGNYKTLLAQLNINVKPLYVDDVCAIALYNLDPNNPRTISGYCLPTQSSSEGIYLDAAGVGTPLQSNIANIFYNNDFRLNNATTSATYDSNAKQLNFSTVLQPAQAASDWSGNISKNGNETTSGQSAQYFVELTVSGTDALSTWMLNDQVSLGNSVGISAPTVIVGSSVSDLVNNLSTFINNLYQSIANSKNNTMQYNIATPTINGNQDYQGFYANRDVYNLDGTVAYKLDSSDVVTDSSQPNYGTYYNYHIVINYMSIEGDSETPESMNAVNAIVPGIRLMFNNKDKVRTINSGNYYNFFYADQNDYLPSGNYKDTLNYPIKKDGVYITCNVANQRGNNSGFQGNLESPANASNQMQLYYRVLTSNPNAS